MVGSSKIFSKIVGRLLLLGKILKITVAQRENSIIGTTNINTAGPIKQLNITEIGAPALYLFKRVSLFDLLMFEFELDGIEKRDIYYM